MADTASPDAVQLRGITKRFPGVVANHDVDITIRKGTVHALIGENGAGKSTLMKILYGVQRPDEGTITVNGEQVNFHSPTDAIEHGIGMVFQHFMLADNLTVLENIVLGAEKLHGIGDKARDAVADISRVYGFGLDPDTLVEQLGVGDRQRVEIVKVLYRGAEIIILDEPTAVLVPQEVDALFENLRGLKNEGHTILFISHKLDEVLDIADDITVMRQGTTVGEAKPGNITEHQLAEMMVGSELPSPETAESTVTDEVLLELKGITLANERGRELLSDVSLTIHRGEVLGIAGVEGNGQEELVETIMGMQTPSAGTIALRGEDMTHWGTRRRREAGVGWIPADRQRHGLLLDSALWENRILGFQTREPAVRGAWIDRSGARSDTERIVERVRRADSEHRHAVARAVGREPAEADRGPRDEQRSDPADRVPPDSRRRRRSASGDLGAHQDSAAARSCRALDLG